jgi:hypothetical protein
MSDNWIDDVIQRMVNSNDPAKVNFANDLRRFKNSNTIIKIVSGVDRNTGELNIIKL